MWDDEFDLHVVIVCLIGAITKGHTSKNLTHAEDTFVGIVMARHQCAMLQTPHICLVEGPMSLEASAQSPC